MVVVVTTETCRNIDRPCKNFRITKFMVHIVNSLQKNTSFLRLLIQEY